MAEQRVGEVLARIPYLDELLAARRAEGESAWLVGGCVRDLLLGRAPADIDLAAARPEPLARRFAGMINARVVPMDPERGIWRVAISAGNFFDFCRFRDTEILGDLAGRDFTLNAIALRLPEDDDDAGGLFDPFRGLDDLNAGVLRMVGPRAFRDDPARILRAFRFQSELGLQIDGDTWAAVRAEADRLPLVAPERLLAEWWKLCAGPHAAAAIARMDESGALATLFPETRAMKGVTQNIYHHLDVWEHTLLAVTYMARFLQHPQEGFAELATEFQPLLQDGHRRARLVFLALLHDIGKPATRSEEDGRVHFYQHEAAGADIAAGICRRLRASNEDCRALATVIRRHLRPLHLLNLHQGAGISEKAMIKFFDDAGDYLLEILALALADKSAGQGPAADPDVLQRLQALYRTLFAFYRERYLPAIEHPLLTGSDLMQHGRLQPGPQIGRLLRRARTLQMLGKLTTRAAALRWAEQPGE